MAREWQPGSRTERAGSAPVPPDRTSADDGRRRDDGPSGSATESATGSVALSDPGTGKGPGGTTGWFPEQDFRRRSRGPAEQRIDPEAVTRHQPAVETQDAGPRTDPAPEDDELYTRASAANAASVAPAGGPERADTDPGEEPATEPANAAPAADEPPECPGQGEDPAAATAAEPSRWQRLVNRTTGGGPLSADRMARERAQQTPSGGDGPEDPAPENDLRHRQEPDLEQGGTMDPSLRMRRIAEQISRGDRDPYTAETYGDEEEEEAAREGLARAGPLVWLIDHWKVIAVPLGMMCLFTFVLATVGLPDLGGGEEVASSRGAPGDLSGSEGGASGSQKSPETAPLYDSGLSFSFSEKEDGTVKLTAGENLSWEGRIEQVSRNEAPEGGHGREKQGSAADAAVEVLRLSGPTAAEVGPGYTMDSGSENPGKVTTTVFAVEGDGVPDMHATFHLFGGESAAGATQRANGSYDVTRDSGELIADGNYSDHRTGAAGGREVIRTYTEQVPGESGYRQFRVRYEAAEGVPIPLLVGWQTPDERPEDLKLEGEM